MGFSRDYTVDPMLSASGNLFKCHEEVLYLQPLIPPKRFDIFSPITGGCSEGLGVPLIFFKHASSLYCRPLTRKKTIGSSLHNTRRTRRVCDADQLDISRSPVGFHVFFFVDILITQRW